METVTIDGTDYVRMTDLGTFTVTSGETTKEYTITKAKMDLVLLTGQSNAISYTAPSNYSDPSPVAPGKAFYLGTDAANGIYAGLPVYGSSGTLEAATITDLTADDGSVNVAGMYPAFCSGYVSQTGHRVLVVNTAIGGKSINQWADGGTCDVWMEDVFDRLSEVVSNGSVVLTPTVALWSQGESDASHTIEFYEQNLIALLEKLWDGDYGYDFDKVLTALPRNSVRDSPTNPALAQMQTAEEHSGFVIASSLPLYFTSEQTRDGTHYTQEVYGWLGEAFARSAAYVTGHRLEAQSIVLPAAVGSVAELPSKVIAYGTSGQGFSMSVGTWSASTPAGTYTAPMTGTHPGTTVPSPLTATAVLLEDWSWDEPTKTLTVGQNVLGPVGAWSGFATEVKSLVIEPGVASLTGTAFRTMTNLEHVSMPSGVTEIGSRAFGVTFADCKDAAIATPTAGEYAGGGGILYLCDPTIFAYDADGTTITGLSDTDATCLVFPTTYNGQTITAIGASAFTSSGVLKAYCLPDTAITTVGSYSFKGCSSLLAASFPKATSVSAELFKGCHALESVNFDSATVASYSSFQNCKALKSASFPMMENLNGSAFNNCVALAAVDLPSVTSMRANDFAYCTAIQTVTFGSALATVDESTFPAWTFYDADGTTVLDKTVASNLAGFTFTGTASALVKQS